MDKNTLNKLLEEKKLTETLMKDESFKKEAKKILKEENSSITDKDISNILTATEKVLSGEVKIKSDKDLDEVVGGMGNLGKSIARKTIKTVCTVGGAVGGNLVGGVVAESATGLNKKVTDFINTGDHLNPEKSLAFLKENASGYAITGVTNISATGAGGFGGYKFGNFICNNLGLND